MDMRCSCFPIPDDNPNSEERQHFAKACHLVMEKGRDMLFFIVKDRKSVSEFRELLKANQWRGKIGVHITNCILGRDRLTISPHEFDISTLYTIIRHGNVLMLQEIPRSGWGIDVLFYNKAVGDDVERIRQLRNKLCHLTSALISESELDEIYEELKDIAKRRGFQATVSEMEQMKNTILSAREIQSIFRDFLEETRRGIEFEECPISDEIVSNLTIQEVKQETEVLKETIKDLKAQVKDTSEPIVVNIRALDMRMVEVKIQKSAQIRYLKQKLEILEDIPLSRQTLSFRGHILDDDKSLAHYSIGNTSNIHLHRYGTIVEDYISMKIHVTLPENKIVTFPVQSSTCVIYVKRKVEVSQNIPILQQRLLFADLELEDSRTLSEYEIKDGDTFRMCFPCCQ